MQFPQSDKRSALVTAFYLRNISSACVAFRNLISRPLTWERTPSAPGGEDLTSPLRWTDSLLNVESFCTFKTDDRCAIEIEKRSIAAEAPALFATFHFGHSFDPLLLSPP